MFNDFSRAAEYYDRIFSARGKDYAFESAIVERQIRTRNAEATTLLDVACGTARHLAHLSEYFETTGLDRDREMLTLGKARLPETPFVDGDMRTFELHRSFDAIVCLFGSIAYLENGDQLERACRRFREHLVDGGVLIIEPFVTPTAYIVGDVSMVTIDEPDFKLARMHVSERDGNVAVLDHHIQVADTAGVHSFVERHRLYLFPEDAFRNALEAARFRYDYVMVEPFRQGLYVATAI